MLPHFIASIISNGALLKPRDEDDVFEDVNFEVLAAEEDDAEVIRDVAVTLQERKNEFVSFMGTISWTRNCDHLVKQLLESASDTVRSSVEGALHSEQRYLRRKRLASSFQSTIIRFYKISSIFSF